MTCQESGIRLIFAATVLALFTGTSRATPPDALTPGQPVCGERYYVLLFGGKAKWWRANSAHTWATYVRTAESPSGPVILESFTISWFPATLRVRPWALLSEPGVNLPLHDTLRHMCRGTGSIALWGPYEIPCERYCRAARYREVLESGAIRYRVIDGSRLGAPANHCVRAVTVCDSDLFSASRPQVWVGMPITRLVASGMRRSGMLVDPSNTHDWLIPALGVDQYDLVRREFGHPLADLFTGW